MFRRLRKFRRTRVGLGHRLTPAELGRAAMGRVARRWAEAGGWRGEDGFAAEGLARRKEVGAAEGGAAAEGGWRGEDGFAAEGLARRKEVGAAEGGAAAEGGWLGGGNLRGGGAAAQGGWLGSGSLRGGWREGGNS